MATSTLVRPTERMETRMSMKSVGEAYLAKQQGKKPRKPAIPYVGKVVQIQRPDAALLRNYRVTLSLTPLPKLTNRLSTNSWAIQASERKKWRKAVVEATVYVKPPRPYRKAKVTFIRHSKVRPDSDGLIASFKAIRDGLIDAGIILDDKYEVIGYPTYDWAYSPAGSGFVTVEVQGVSL